MVQRTLFGLLCSPKGVDIFSVLLNEVMIVLELNENLVSDTREKRILKNIRNYSVKFAMFNW